MNKPVKDKFLVLLADDSADDRFLLRRGLEPAARLQLLAETRDGVQTIAYLDRQNSPRHRDEFPLPDLLLLDLNMPGRDGFEVLKWLQPQPFAKDLTVVVLTGSVRPQDIQRALELGAHLYQVKPHSHNDLNSMIHALEEYLENRPRLLLPEPSSRKRTARIPTVC